jgi:hypothetical protein
MMTATATVAAEALMTTAAVVTATAAKKLQSTKG